jgi:hypothetical protein
MNSELEKIKSKIEKLDKNESIEIFKILLKNQIIYSQNNNGIFIDLNGLNENCIVEIKAFIEFIEENKKHIQEIESKMKQNKISLDNKNFDRNSKFEVMICNDYSPFITDLDDNFIEDEEIISLEKISEDVRCGGGDEDLNEIIDDDDEIEEPEIDEDNTSSNLIVKKKKTPGLAYRIMKKCKNINAINGDIDEFEKEFNEEQQLKELPLESEYF